jgi:hypothetical protein
MDLFLCPPPTAIANIPTFTCPIRWDQIQKMLFRRITGRAALTTSTALLSATITPLLTAVDATKLIVSPYLANVVIPPNEILKEGGNDNTTINGIPQFRGLGAVGGTALLRNAPATVAAAIGAITPETSVQPGQTNIEAIFVQKDGKIIGANPSSTVFVGFPLYNLVITDVSTEGFGKDNVYNISFDLAPGWSDKHTMLTPTDWSALTIAN